MLQQFVFHSCRVSLRLVDLIHRNHNRHVCRLGMADSFNCLRHHSIISGNDENNNICYFGSPRTHCRKGRVTRRIDESYFLTIIFGNLISPDMLGNTPSLTGDNTGFTQCVKQGCFTMVNVTHNSHNRRTRLFIFISIFFRIDAVFYICICDTIDLMPQFFGKQFGSIGINRIVDFCHNTLLHQQFNDIHSSLRHAVRKFLNSN